MTVHANGRMLGTGTEINAKWKVDEERARGGKSDFTSDPCRLPEEHRRAGEVLDAVVFSLARKFHRSGGGRAADSKPLPRGRTRSCFFEATRRPATTP